jgi:hypothetical protein
MARLGLIATPIGTRINIDNRPDGARNVPIDSEQFPSGHADAIVTDVYLWGTQSPARIAVPKVDLVPPGERGDWMVDRSPGGIESA